MSRKSLMLVSRERSQYKEVDVEKTAHGKFYTSLAFWLTKPVRNFLRSALQSSNGVLDPFAGDGHLLDECAEAFGCTVKGLDIAAPRWPSNDSLSRIDNKGGFAICTNPPYLARYSAKRKGVWTDVERYLSGSRFEDLYQVALARCLEAARFVAAIVPETFLHSSFSKQQLVLASVIEPNPFLDTDEPTCVACFDTAVSTGEAQARLFKGDTYCLTMGEMHAIRGKPSNSVRVRFNDPHGRLALRAVDSSNPSIRAGFALPKDFDYCRTRIKHSSRLLTYVEPLDVHDSALTVIVEKANSRLDETRRLSHDLALSPFKGNNSAGIRRRRLDYGLARTILEWAIKEQAIASPQSTATQPDLFAITPSRYRENPRDPTN